MECIDGVPKALVQQLKVVMNGRTGAKVDSGVKRSDGGENVNAAKLARLQIEKIELKQQHMMRQALSPQISSQQVSTEKTDGEMCNGKVFPDKGNLFENLSGFTAELLSESEGTGDAKDKDHHVSSSVVKTEDNVPSCRIASDVAVSNGELANSSSHLKEPTDASKTVHAEHTVADNKVLDTCSYSSISEHSNVIDSSSTDASKPFLADSSPSETLGTMDSINANKLGKSTEDSIDSSKSTDVKNCTNVRTDVTVSDSTSELIERTNANCQAAESVCDDDVVCAMPANSDHMTASEATKSDDAKTEPDAHLEDVKLNGDSNLVEKPAAHSAASGDLPMLTDETKQKMQEASLSVKDEESLVNGERTTGSEEGCRVEPVSSSSVTATTSGDCALNKRRLSSSSPEPDDAVKKCRFDELEEQSQVIDNKGLDTEMTSDVSTDASIPNQLCTASTAHRGDKLTTISLKELNELVARLSRCQQATIDSLKQRIGQLEKDGAMWKARAKELQRSIVNITIVQQRQRRTANTSNHKVQVRNCGVQIDEEKIQAHLKKFASNKMMTASVGAVQTSTTHVTPQPPPAAVVSTTTMSTTMATTVSTTVSTAVCSASSATTTNVSSSDNRVSTPQTGLLLNRNPMVTVRQILNTQRVTTIENSMTTTATRASAADNKGVIDLTDDDDVKPVTHRLVTTTLAHTPSATPQVQQQQQQQPPQRLPLQPPQQQTAAPAVFQCVIAPPAPATRPNTVILQPTCSVLMPAGTARPAPRNTTTTYLYATPAVPSRANNQPQMLALATSRPPPPLQASPALQTLTHPAPLPQLPPKVVAVAGIKLLPPKPSLKISRVQQGIVLSWSLELEEKHEQISNYQLFAYQEGSLPASSALWKKVGDVKALPLPMACTLTQFQEGNKYHFAVRAVDRFMRSGPFSDPSSIHLQVQPS